jgi:hypothetical protein
MNRNRLKPIVFLLITLLLAASLMGCGSKYAGDVVEIQKLQQETGASTADIYDIVISKDFDWATAAAKDKEGLAKYSVNEALKQAEADESGNYSILGTAEETNDTLFMFDGVNTIKLAEGGAWGAEVTLK